MILFILTIIARLIPHPANMTPLVVTALIAGTYSNRLYGYCALLGSLLVSDILLGMIQHHAIFGLWSLFTSSGVLIISYPSQYLSRAFTHSKITHVLLGGIFYWAWTNLSSWLSMYTIDWTGFMACYINALPFLHNQLIGDTICLIAWIITLNININQSKERSPWTPKSSTHSENT